MIRFRMDSENSNHGYLDCFVLSNEPFQPQGILKPDAVTEAMRQAARQNEGWIVFNPAQDSFQESAGLDLRSLNDISDHQTRHHREPVRYRAKLVGLRSGLKAQVHAVLAKLGIGVPMSDLFGVGGRQLLEHLLAEDERFRSAFGLRVESLLELIATFDHEIVELTDSISHRLRDHQGYQAIQELPGIGPIIAAIMVAEIGDVNRFASPGHLGLLVRADPTHRESDTTVRRGSITKQGNRLMRSFWAAIEAAQKLRTDSWLHAERERLAERRGSRNIAKVAIARKLVTLVYYGLRDGEIRCLHRQPEALPEAA